MKLRPSMQYDVLPVRRKLSCQYPPPDPHGDAAAENPRCTKAFSAVATLSIAAHGILTPPLQAYPHCPGTYRTRSICDTYF